MAHSMYLTFAEYTDYGGTLPQAAFTPLELKARKRVDYLTDSRVQNMEVIPEAVKLCMMSLIAMDNAAGAEAQIENPVVTSFSTDGYSESYGRVSGVAGVKQNMNAVIGNFLFGETDDEGVPLLYRGVNR